MVLDTSVLVAVLLGEPDSRAILEKMRVSRRRLFSAASLFEAGVALMRHASGDHEYRLDPFLRRGAVEIVPVDYGQALLARDAYRRFGKGRHPASLNLGDCFSYALAMQTGDALLFKGRDFSKTDVVVA